MAHCRRSSVVPESKAPNLTALGEAGQNPRLHTFGHETVCLAFPDRRFGCCPFAQARDKFLSAVCARGERRRIMKRARYKQGSVVLNRRNNTWFYLWCD